MTRVIGCRVYFDWGIDGTFTDESANVVSVSGDTRFVPPEALVVGSQGIVDKCTIELRNAAGRYSALNSSGVAPNGDAYHVPVYVDTTLNANAGSPTWTRAANTSVRVPPATVTAR